MAERESSGNARWIGFLVGAVLVALVGVGYFMTIGQAPREHAQLEINMPQVRTPDINLPAPPPAPSLPPAAEPAPAQ